MGVNSIGLQTTGTLFKNAADSIRSIDIRERVKDVAFVCFTWLARIAIFAASGFFFKRNVNHHKIQESRTLLKNFGGEEMTLANQTSKHPISVMYFDYQKCLEKLIGMGGEIVADKNILRFYKSNQPLISLLKERLGVQLIDSNDTHYHIILGKSDKTVVYAPGSGHLFELRKKTIGRFLLSYGANVVTFNYSGTGKSGGAAKKDSIAGDMNTLYDFVKSHGMSDDRMVFYGHCVGAGPTLQLASKHPLVNVIVDRTFLSLGAFAKLRVQIACGIPERLTFLVGWVESVISHFYPYDNVKNVKNISGRVVVLSGTKDELIPPTYGNDLYKSSQAQTKLHLKMDLEHDPDLIYLPELAHSIFSTGF